MTLDALDGEVDREMNAAVDHAIAATAPGVDTMFRDVYADGEPPPRPLGRHLLHHPARASSMAAIETTYRDALRQALIDAMNEDPSVFIMGEEVGRYGAPIA